MTTRPSLIGSALDSLIDSIGDYLDTLRRDRAAGDWAEVCWDLAVAVGFLVTVFVAAGTVALLGWLTVTGLLHTTWANRAMIGGPILLMLLALRLVWRLTTPRGFRSGPTNRSEDDR